MGEEKTGRGKTERGKEIKRVGVGKKVEWERGGRHVHRWLPWVTMAGV